MKAAPMVCLTIAILLFSTGAWIMFEEAQNPVLFNTVVNGQFIAANQLIDELPEVSNRVFIGNQEAPISVVAYLIMQSPVSRQFIEETYSYFGPHVRAGLVRYYPRYVLMPEDLREKTDAYWMAMGLACSPVGPSYESLYTRVFSLSGKEELLNVAAELQVDSEEWRACIQGEPPVSVRVDAAESKRFGIGPMQPKTIIGVRGRDNSLLTGILSEERVAEVVRDYEVKIGR